MADHQAISPNKAFSHSVALALLVGSGVAASPQMGMAHTVKVASDVAVTIHIEPNHNPKAGEPAQTWFLLTQVGGTPIPLQACDCRLAVYAQQGEQTDAPILQPLLTAMAAEQYQNLPGADIVFPAPGAYTLKFTGTPKADIAFQPFETTFDVTVATGQIIDPSDGQNNVAGESDENVDESAEAATGPGQSWGAWAVGAIATLVLVGVITVRAWKRSK